MQGDPYRIEGSEIEYVDGPLTRFADDATIAELERQARRIAELEAALVRINEKAVQLRDEIGTGSAVAELRGRVHNIVELSRKFMATK